MAFVSFRWKVSDGSCIMLELPPGWDGPSDNGYCYTTACSADGSWIVGYASPDGNTDYPCVWDGHTGALTILSSTTLDVRECFPYGISLDGTKIVGVGSQSNRYDIVWWTTRTNGISLPPLGPTHTVSSYRVGWEYNMMSADGSVVVGGSIDNAAGGVWHNCVWTNGVPSDWGSIRGPINPTTGNAIRYLSNCSGDGQTMLTDRGYGSNVPQGIPGFFRAHTFYPLSGSFPGSSNYYAGLVYGAIDDGSVIYGVGWDAFGIERVCYWDNLTSITGTQNFGDGPQNTYGTIHILPANTAGCTIEDFARASPGLAGHAYNTVMHAIRWVGSTFKDLQPGDISGSFVSGRGMSCNGDGTITVGEGIMPEYGNQQVACYWDAAGVQHRLFFPPESGVDKSPSGGYAMGISRDGSIIHGQGDVDFTAAAAGFWEFKGNPKGAFGDAWSDPSYVNFGDDTVRAGFIGSDNGWLTLGPYGETPTGTSPISFLTAQSSNSPWDITTGYGQDYGQDSWDAEWGGTNPDTGLDYPDLAFDECDGDIIIPPVHHLHAADYTFTVSQFSPFVGSAATDTTSDATNLAYLEFGPSSIIEFEAGRVIIDIGGGFTFTPVVGFQTSSVTYTVREILKDGSVGLTDTGTITFIPLTMPLSPGETDEFCACPPCEVLTLCRPRDTFVMRPGRKC
jgi:hypothetical protein